MDKRIVIDPTIQHGKPVIRGTRVPVARIIAGLAGGMTPADVMKEYEVGEADIYAALRFAVHLIETEQFHTATADYINQLLDSFLSQPN